MNRFTLTAFAALGAWLLPIGGASAFAQSINIDFAGQTAPPDTYGGGGPTGVWNLVPDGNSIPRTLVDVTGKPVDVELSLSVPGTQFTSLTNPEVTDPGDDRLLNDFLSTQGFQVDSIEVELTGLKDGEYEVVIYAWFPQTVGPSDHLSLAGASSTNDELIGLFSVGAVWTGQPLNGVTHITKFVNVRNNVLNVTVHGPCINCSQAKINGLQIMANPIPGDSNDDGVIDGSDLLELLADWGFCGVPQCETDLNGDFAVNGTDLLMLLASWSI